MSELHYGIILRNYITGLYPGIRLGNYITEWFEGVCVNYCHHGTPARVEPSGAAALDDSNYGN